MKAEKTFVSAFAARLDAYMTFRVARGFSRATHLGALVFFDRFCAMTRPDATGLTRDVAFGCLENARISGRGIANLTVALRSFARYLTACGESSYILPTRLTPPRATPPPYLPSGREMCEFFKKVDELDASFRDVLAPGTLRTLLRLTCVCGLRPKEGLRIRRTDLDIRSRMVRIADAKMHKDRNIAISEDMARMLGDYVRRRDITARDDGPLFARRDGRELSLGTVRKSFKKAWQTSHAAEAGPVPRLRIYDMRHLFASRVLQKWQEDGRDVYAMLPKLRAYMGHETILSTLYYVRLLPDRLVKSRSVAWDALNGMVPED